MLREPFGKNRVGVCELETDCIVGDRQRKIPMMFFYPSDTGSVESSYKDATFQKEKLNNNVIDNGVRTYCYTDGKLSSEVDKYPVIVYSHGLFGFQMESTVLCADLASNGFIVVSIGHPYGSSAVTYSDGTMFEVPKDFIVSEKNLEKIGVLWEEDILHAIGYLEKIQNGQVDCSFCGRLDVENGINLLGVSFGGCCSIGVALKDKRVKCSINFDGGLFIKLNPIYKDKPILILCNSFNYKSHSKLKKLACSNYSVKKIKKVTHWEFSDGVYLSEKGKKNRQWADEVSENRAKMCIDFIKGI